MIPAQPKRYYSVKDAANLLGVSTNTIYTYLKEGKITSRRIGQGRFKIPYSQLAVYMELQPHEMQVPVNITPEILDSGQISQPEKAISAAPQEDFRNNPVIKEVAASEKASIGPTFKQQRSQQESEIQEFNFKNSRISDIDPLLSERSVDYISPMQNDKIFWRLFKGLSYLGFGIIYSFTSNLVFNFSGSFFEESAQVFNFIMPSGLIFSGILTLLDVFYEEKVRPIDLLVHIISAAVLSYFAFMSVVSGEYGRFVFAASFAILVTLHLVRGVKHDGTFYENFTKFTVLLTVIGGLVLILFPSLFPIPYFSEMVLLHRGVFGVLWFGLLTVPSLYLLSDIGKKTKGLASFFYLLSGIMALIFATELAVEGKWDSAYITYLLGIFGIFLAFWISSSIVIQTKKFNLISLSFIWVSVAILIGLFVVNNTSMELKRERETIVLSNFDQSIQKFKSKLDESSALLVGYAGKPEIVSLIDEKSEEALIAKAKEIYERSGITSRVLIYDKDGKALGVYPREPLAQGTDFSGRDYFQKTKSDLRGVISNVFVAVNGNKTIMVTEPVFKDNAFYGTIGMAIDLKKLSLNLQSELGKDNFIHVVDEKGIYAFGSNTDDIGKKVSEIDYLSFNKHDQNIKNDYILYQSTMNSPAWNFFLQIPDYSLASETSYVNVFLSFFVVVNSIFSVFAGLAISTKRKSNEDSNSVKQVSINPGINLGTV